MMMHGKPLLEIRCALPLAGTVGKMHIALAAQPDVSSQIESTYPRRDKEEMIGEEIITLCGRNCVCFSPGPFNQFQSLIPFFVIPQLFPADNGRRTSARHRPHEERAGRGSR